MPTVDQDKRLIKLLENKTVNDRLKWTESGRDAEFIARVKTANGDIYSFTVGINRLIEMPPARYVGKSPVTIQVMLPEGLEIAHIEVRPEDSEYSVARRIYDRALASSRKTPELLSEAEAVLTGL